MMTPPQPELPYFSFANLKCVLWYWQMLIIAPNFYYAWIYKLNLLYKCIVKVRVIIILMNMAQVILSRTYGQPQIPWRF